MYSSALNPNNVPSGNAKYMKQWIQDYVNIETVRKCFRCGETIFAGTAVYMATDGKIYTYQTSADDTYIGVAAENAKTNEFADVVLQGYLRVPGAPWVAGVLYYTNAVGILTPIPVTRRVAVGVGDSEIVIYSQLDLGVSALTANNGLTVNVPGNVQLGGTLINITDINFTTGDLTLSHASGSYAYLYPGFIFNYDNGLGGSLVQVNAQGGLPAYFATITQDPLEDNTVETTLFLSRSTTNTPGVGIGASINCQVQGFDASSIITKLTNILPSATSSIEFYNLLNGVSTRKAVIAGTGQWTWDKYGVGTFVDTPAYYLGVKADGSVIETALSSLVSASNGLTESPTNNIKLGGTLTEKTTIDTTSLYNLTINSSAPQTTGAAAFIVNNSAGDGVAIYGNCNTTNSVAVKGNAPSGTGTQGVGLIGLQGLSSTGGGVAIWGIASSSATAVQGNAATGIPLLGNATPATTNTVVPTLQLERNTSGTAANGIGQEIVFKTRTTGFLPEIANKIISKYTDATSATRTSQYILTGVNAAVEADLHTVSGNGQHKLNQYGVGTFTGTPTGILATTATGEVIETGGSGGAMPLMWYGSFYDITDQVAPGANTPTPMEFGQTDIASGVSITNNLSGDPTRITFANAGVYNIQFSAQLFRSGGGSSEVVTIWFRKNGTNIPSSSTNLTLQSNSDYLVAAWNFFVSVTAGQYVEIMWSTTDAAISLQHLPENLVVPYPEVPSVIVTASRVS